MLSPESSRRSASPRSKSPALGMTVWATASGRTPTQAPTCRPRLPRLRRSRSSSQLRRYRCDGCDDLEQSAVGANHLDTCALRQLRPFDPPDRVAGLYRAAPIDDGIDEIEGL